MTDSVEVLWPGGESAVERMEPAARPATLHGKRIGFLWDHMFRGDEIFPMLEDRLRDEFTDVEFVGFEEFGSTFGGDEHAVLDALPERLAAQRVDAVISGIGA